MDALPWQADFEFTAEDCRAIVARHIPHLADREVRHLGDGWCLRAFLVGDDLVAKFPKRSDAVDHLEAETALLSRLGTLPVQIPIPVCRGEPGPDLPYLMTVQTRVRGVPANRTLLSAEDTEQLIQDALGALRALRGQTGEADLPGVGQWFSPEMLETTLGEARSLLAEIGHDLEPRLADAIEDLYAAPPPAPSPGLPVLCHGDLVPEHLFLGPDRRLAGIIDWGDACFGDVAQDVAGLGFLAPPGRLAPHLRGADPGILERARYRLVVAALHAVWFGIRESRFAAREGGLRAIEWWLPG